MKHNSLATVAESRVRHLNPGAAQVSAPLLPNLRRASPEVRKHERNINKIPSKDFSERQAASAILRRGAFTEPSRRPAAERAYYKALRKAELTAWEAYDVRRKVAANSLPEVKASQRHSDAWLLTLIACIAANALVFTFRDALDITQHWAGVARFIHQLFA